MLSRSESKLRICLEVSAWICHWRTLGKFLSSLGLSFLFCKRKGLNSSMFHIHMFRCCLFVSAQEMEAHEGEVTCFSVSSTSSCNSGWFLQTDAHQRVNYPSRPDMSTAKLAQHVPQCTIYPDLGRPSLQKQTRWLTLKSFCVPGSSPVPCYLFSHLTRVPTPSSQMLLQVNTWRIR